MFHEILGFGGRMGRLEYFLACMGLGILMGLLVVALTAGFMPHLGHGESGPVPTALLVILVGIVLPIYLWFALAFQAKRFRDMGWDPIYALPLSIGVLSIIWLLSPIVHVFALVGALLNIALSLCLLFWPSAPTGNGGWYGGSYDGSPDPEPTLDRPPAVAARRPAAVRAPAPPPVFTPAPSGFGRRKL